MKKLVDPYHQLPQGVMAAQIQSLIIAVNQLIDENEQLKEQFKILAERAGWDIEPGAKFEPADDKPYGEGKLGKIAEEQLERERDTHRTVTLRIPKGMRIGEAIYQAEGRNGESYFHMSDTDLQKALNEVQPNE